MPPRPAPTTALTERRSGPITQGDVSQAGGHAERRAAPDMGTAIPEDRPGG